MWIRTVTRTVENCCKYYSATAGGAQGVANARCGRLAAEGNLGAWTRSLLPPRCVLLSSAKLLCTRVVISMQYLTVMDNEVLKRKLPSHAPSRWAGASISLEVVKLAGHVISIVSGFPPNGGAHGRSGTYVHGFGSPPDQVCGGYLLSLANYGILRNLLGYPHERSGSGGAAGRIADL